MSNVTPFFTRNDVAGLPFTVPFPSVLKPITTYFSLSIVFPSSSFVGILGSLGSDGFLGSLGSNGITSLSLITTSFVNVPVTVRSLSTLVFLSSAGVHFSNEYPSAGVVFGAFTSASVFPDFLST